MNIKNEIVNELDNRLKKLKEHHYDDKNPDNAYEGLHSALGRVIGASLMQEIQDIKSFVEDL